MQTFTEEPKKMLIGGEWVASSSGETFAVYNPATGAELAKVAAGNEKDINLAVEAARRAFEGNEWHNMTPSQRGKLVWRLGDLIEQNAEELAQLESLDNGKPYSVAKVADIPLAADLFHYMAGWATKIEGSTIPVSTPRSAKAQHFVYTMREPVGVVGQIIPWNFPLLMAAWKLGACSCCRLYGCVKASRTNSTYSASFG